MVKIYESAANEFLKEHYAKNILGCEGEYGCCCDSSFITGVKWAISQLRSDECYEGTKYKGNEYADGTMSEPGIEHYPDWLEREAK